MRAFLKSASAGAVLAAWTAIAVIAPAQAATVLFDFGSQPSGASGSNWGSVGPASPTAANAWDANSRIFSATSGATTVKVRVSGWSIDSSGVVQDSFLGGFSGAGLGVTSGDDSRGVSGKHSIDNQTRTDFVLLQFDRAVDLDRAKFNAISISGLGYTDTDATIGGGNTTLNWQTQPNLNGQTVAALNAIIPTTNRFGNYVGAPNGGTSGSNTRAVNPGNYSGNVWLISAALATHNTDNKIDAFKLDAVQASFLAALPEPGTWATMIIGFGMIGGVVRRRRRTLTAA